MTYWDDRQSMTTEREARWAERAAKLADEAHAERTPFDPMVWADAMEQRFEKRRDRYFLYATASNYLRWNGGRWEWWLDGACVGDVASLGECLAAVAEHAEEAVWRDRA